MYKSEDGRMHVSGRQTPNGIGSQDWVGDDTGKAYIRTEQTDDCADDNDIVPQVYRNVRSTVRLWKSSQETSKTEQKEEMIRTRFTPDKALKRAM